MSMDFAPHEQRVIDEHRELTVRLNKLRSFFGTQKFAALDGAEQARMRAQAVFMHGYQDMLEERIEARIAANSRPTADETDAKRYRWLREQNWNDGLLAVVADPKDAVKLGYDCPSLDRLDAEIDAAMLAQLVSQNKQENNE
jgi:hypothetical protein